MLRFLCKSLHLIKTRVGDSTTKLCFVQNPSLRFFSISTNQPSFTVSYLTNSCGLSQEAAISASKYVHLETSEKADSVLTLLVNHGLTKTLISDLIRRWPLLLLANPEKILKPKIEFFKSIGFSTPDLVKILSADVVIFKTSLKNQLIPSIDFLKTILRTNENVIKVIKRETWILRSDKQRNMVSNIAVLRDHGVPESHIMTLVKNQPRSLLTKPDRFSKTVKETVEMGFDPSIWGFVCSVYVRVGLTKSSWEKKLEAYRKWGWSEEETLSAFKIQPGCMIISEKKIMKVMDFLVNKMYWKSSVIAKCPSLLTYSLEKRVIPRCLVIKFLLSKGLIKDIKITTWLMSNDTHFSRRYLTRYLEEVPELVKIYQGNTDFLGGFRS